RPENRVITDLDKAPRNAQGTVEYETDFFILRPVDPRPAGVAVERADPRPDPAVAAPGWLSGAIEEPRDLLVGHQARQLADQRQGVFGHRPAMLAAPIHPQLQRGVVSALPMQDHLDEAAFDARDDLVQRCAQD